MANLEREVQLKFRVTPEERALIEQKMAQLGTTNMAAYLRKMAIDGFVINLELPELREMVSLLRRSSNNLNQENICQGGFHPKDEIPPDKLKVLSYEARRTSSR